MESGAANTDKPRRMKPRAALRVVYLAAPGKGFWISTAFRRILDIVVAVNALLAMPLVWSGVSRMRCCVPTLNGRHVRTKAGSSRTTTASHSNYGKYILKNFDRIVGSVCRHSTVEGSPALDFEAATITSRRIVGQRV
jgi:hypothetical protein